MPSLKACLFLKKIKGSRALDGHERRSLYNLLSIHSQQHQQRKTRLFSLGNPGKHPRQFFQQANTLGSPNPLHREMTCLSACCVLSFKGFSDPQVVFFSFFIVSKKTLRGLPWKPIHDWKIKWLPPLFLLRNCFWKHENKSDFILAFILVQLLIMSGSYVYLFFFNKAIRENTNHLISLSQIKSVYNRRSLS